MIRKAAKKDLSRIIEITKSCAAFMISQNIFQALKNKIYFDT